jgi:hypothetical protein
MYFSKQHRQHKRLVAEAVECTGTSSEGNLNQSAVILKSWCKPVQESNVISHILAHPHQKGAKLFESKNPLASVCFSAFSECSANNFALF